MTCSNSWNISKNFPVDRGAACSMIVPIDETETLDSNLDFINNTCNNYIIKNICIINHCYVFDRTPVDSNFELKTLNQ
jgi:hypothetical protein